MRGPHLVFPCIVRPLSQQKPVVNLSSQHHGIPLRPYPDPTPPVLYGPAPYRYPNQRFENISKLPTVQTAPVRMVIASFSNFPYPTPPVLDGLPQNGYAEAKASMVLDPPKPNHKIKDQQKNSTPPTNISVHGVYAKIHEIYERHKELRQFLILGTNDPSYLKQIEAFNNNVLKIIHELNKPDNKGLKQWVSKFEELLPRENRKTPPTSNHPPRLELNCLTEEKAQVGLSDDDYSRDSTRTPNTPNRRSGPLPGDLPYVSPPSSAGSSLPVTPRPEKNTCDETGDKISPQNLFPDNNSEFGLNPTNTDDEINHQAKKKLKKSDENPEQQNLKDIDEASKMFPKELTIESAIIILKNPDQPFHFIPKELRSQCLNYLLTKNTTADSNKHSLKFIFNQLRINNKLNTCIEEFKSRVEKTETVENLIKKIIKHTKILERYYFNVFTQKNKTAFTYLETISNQLHFFLNCFLTIPDMEDRLKK